MAGPARTLWQKASPRNTTDEGLLPATTQTIHLCRLCRCSESAFLTRNSVATQTQQANGQCRGRERIPNPEPEMHLSHQRGSHGRRLSHGKAIVRFIRFVLLSICFKRQRWSIPPNWRTRTRYIRCQMPMGVRQQPKSGYGAHLRNRQPRQSGVDVRQFGEKRRTVQSAVRYRQDPSPG